MAPRVACAGCTVLRNGTVWAGGDGGGRLFQVTPGSATAQFRGPLLADPTGRVEDLGVDQRGRLHAVVFAPQTSGAIVLDQGVACQTVNVLDPAYPLRDPQGRPSPSTRVVAAADGAVWLLGSDGGVTQVADTFRDGRCPATGVSVQYGPVLRRQDGLLPTNTVPALVVGRDGALWLGTALGLTRLREGQVTPVRFQREVTVQGDVVTLEAFFQAVAQAIFTAQPLETVALGGVSFVEAFGRPLVKEDLIFSAAEEAQGRLWVGTLGGGLRRIELRDGVPQDTLHLTRQEGLGGNLILALALGPDGALWAATDEGVSRLRPSGETVTITNFTGLENVPRPVHDVAVDAAGTVWLATDEGLFRLQPGSGSGATGSGSVVSGPRLIPVAGNNQSALPGQELPTPLVVRLEDQLGASVVGTPLTATLLQGDAVFLSAPTTMTDAQGEVCFRLRAGQSEADLLVEVAVPALPEVAPVPFLAIIGEVDTPGTPRDIAVAGDLVFVAANAGSLQVIDCFDAFPTDPREIQDTDRDHLGDTADPDDDNNGFPDAEDQQATPPTDPLDARSFPVRLPPASTTTLVVDAASTLLAPERTDTPEAPYWALSEALQALRTGRLPQVHTIQVRAGTYATPTTQERFPLDLSRMAGLTLRGKGRVVIDAGSTANGFTAAFSRDLVIEGFVITRGINGIAIQASTTITIRHNQITEHNTHGIIISTNATGIVITANLLANNEQHGLQVTGNSEATVTQKTMRQNGVRGMSLNSSRATIEGNLFEGNLQNGISIVSGSTAELTGNTIEDNFFHGIFNDSTLLALENTIRRNRGNGMRLTSVSTTTISGGLITLNGYAGIFLPAGASASIGLDGEAELVMSHNVAAGLRVETDVASARINSGRVRFEANGGGAIVGRVTDVFVDSDGDDLGDADEAAQGTNSRRPDTDGDSLRDGFEARYGLALLDPRDSLADPDGDGLTNGEEQTAGTDPRNPDTDGDRLTDCDEVRVYGTDPTQADTDSDGLTDSEEVRQYRTNPLAPDSDGDSVLDGTEVAARSDPRDSHSVPTAVLYGVNALRNDLLVLNPPTGQAFVLGPPTGDPNLASGAPSAFGVILWSPHNRTLYALGGGFIGVDAQRRLHTLDPDTDAILTTVVITSDTGNTFVVTALGIDARGTLLVPVNTGGGSLADLGRLDPTTGVVTRLGPTGFGTLFGLQFDPTFRTLYAITGNRVLPVLVSLDPTTGQGTVIAQTNLPTQAESLAFTADGRLVVGGDDGNLYQVDPVTGAATLIGPSGVEEVSSLSLRVLR